jgi:hypothetical protein
MRLPFCAAMLLVIAAPGSAQQIRGVAIDTAGRPVPDVIVEIRTRSGAVLSPVSTDSGGRFQFVLPAPGIYELHASRIGYAAIGPSELIADRGRYLELVLRMSTDAIALDPVEVTVRRAARTRADEVRSRIEWVRRIGIGHTMTREEIEERSAPTLPALVAALSPRVRTIAPITGRDAILIASPRFDLGVCVPDFYLDDVPMAGVVETNLVNPEHLEAVELYIGGVEIPAQYSGSVCGVVLFWTRSGADLDGPRPTWKRYALGGAIVAVILFIGLN